MLLGAGLVAALAAGVGTLTGPRLASRLEVQANRAIATLSDGEVRADFTTTFGQPTRHPVLRGAEGVDEAVRERIARTVAAIPGVGGIRWADGTAFARGSNAPAEPLACEEDVATLLRSRTIRFEEGSARIDAVSAALVDEVAAALRPCLGSIIAITGHTDASGPEPGNLELSRSRAEAVRDALTDRGIPADGLRASGLGSRSPVRGLEPADTANRRIEFSVIATRAVRPTPVDTPAPR
jgi:OOP family OmpA-OmpF porin